MRVLLASSNRHKLTEFRRILRGSPIELTDVAERGLEGLHVEETGATFAENAELKARAYLQRYSIPVLADDSGISVDALAGAPGVKSARFGRADFDDEARTAYLLHSLRDVPRAARGAHYTCSLVLACPGMPPVIATARLYGYVAERARPGATGFGYDPLFEVPGTGCTISELTPEQKDAVSHRGRAARRLLELLSREGDSRIH